MDGSSLPPELRQFADDAVAAGHHRDTAEVVRAGVELLKHRDQARADLLATVQAAKQEAEKTGYLSAEAVAIHVRETIVRSIGTLR